VDHALVHRATLGVRIYNVLPGSIESFPGAAERSAIGRYAPMEEVAALGGDGRSARVSGKWIACDIA
jgi:hypothetical protein